MVTTVVGHVNGPQDIVPLDMTEWALPRYSHATVSNNTSTAFDLEATHSSVFWSFEGTGFTYDSHNDPLTGTVTSFDIADGYDTLVSGFSMDVATFNGFVNAQNTAGFLHAIFSGDDSFASLYHALGDDGNDTFTGCTISEGGSGDDSITVTQGGADVGVYGGDGDDSVTFAGGTLTDHVFGGDGTDTLTFDEPQNFANPVVIALPEFDAAALASMGFESVQLADVDGDFNDNNFDFASLPMNDEPASFTFHAYGGNDTIVGLADKPNTIYGDAGSDTLTGGSANDVLWSSDALNLDSEADTMYGGEGDDTFHVSGPDTVYGGGGDDLVETTNSTALADSIQGGAGTDELAGGWNVAGSFNAAAAGFELTGGNSFTGSDDANTIDISALQPAGPDFFRDQINGMAGDDVLTGLGTAVTVLYGGDGNDQLFGGAAADILSGDAGDDRAYGGAGDDQINGGAGTNKLYGGDGSDNINTSGAGDLAYGGDGNDVMTVDAGTAKLYGGDGADTFVGSDADEAIYGGKGADTIEGGAGSDTVKGGAGNDAITIAANGAFPSTSRIDGGAGHDTVNMSGIFGPIVLKAHTITNVETFDVGSPIAITTADGTVAAGATLTVNTIGNSDVTFDGSAETNGRFIFNTGGGDDSLTGGAGNDQFLVGTGSDTVHGGGGNDTIVFDDVDGFGPEDKIDGGAGADVVQFVSISGSDGSPLIFSANTLTNVETLVLSKGTFFDQPYTYDLTLDDGNVAAGATLTIDGSALGTASTAVIDAGAEKDGIIAFKGGDAGDTFIGGQFGNIFNGGGGSDQLTAGAGPDSFTYDSITDSTGSNYDTITGFDGNADTFSLSFAIDAVDPALTSGTLRAAHVNPDLGTAITASVLGAHHAVLFTPDAGTLAGDTFLVIDRNGVAGYQGNQDFVIELVNATNLGNLAADFRVH